MEKRNTMSAGELSLRLGMFVAADVALSLLLPPLLARMAASNAGGEALPPSLGPATLAAPALLAALAAWCLPRPVSLTVVGRRRSWIWFVLLFLGGAIAYFAVTGPGREATVWDAARSNPARLSETLGWQIAAVPAAAVRAFIAVGVLAALARKVFSAAVSGCIAALAMALSTILLSLAKERSGSSVLRGDLTLVGWQMLFALAVAAVWALLYSGLARLLDGRNMLARTALAALVLTPVFASLRQGVINVPVSESIGTNLILNTLLGFSFPLGLGVAAWIMSFVPPPASPTGTRSAAASGS